MSIGRLENSIYSPHMVTPDRVVVPTPADRRVVPGPKPFDAPPGVVPFHRMLESENLAYNPDTQRLAIPRQPDVYVHSTPDQSSLTQLLPKLGEILPVTARSLRRIQVEQTRQIQLPATGRLLDVYL